MDAHELGYRLRKEWVQPYALKALPVTLVWLKLCYEMMTKDYQREIRVTDSDFKKINHLLI